MFFPLIDSRNNFSSVVGDRNAGSGPSHHSGVRGVINIADSVQNHHSAIARLNIVEN